MIGIDTNVLVRLLVDDEPKQSALARKLIAKASPGELFITLIVMAELAWVLKRSYQIEPAEILGTLEKLLTTKEFTIERPGIAALALVNARAANAGFADALIDALNADAGCETTASFDARAKRLPTMRGVGALL